MSRHRVLAGRIEWRCFALLWLTLCTGIASAAAPQAPLASPNVRSFIDIPYARVGDKVLALDLHMPVGRTQPPLVVYLHGGVWRLGDKEEVPPFLVERGYAVASLNFRSSEEAV